MAPYDPPQESRKRESLGKCLLLQVYSFLCPRKNAAKPRLPRGRLACSANQVLRFEGLKEFDNIGKELGSGNGEVVSQIVRDLVNGMMGF